LVDGPLPEFESGVLRRAACQALDSKPEETRQPTLCRGTGEKNPDFADACGRHVVVRRSTRGNLAQTPDLPHERRIAAL
jgi:hypothetical protein